MMKFKAFKVILSTMVILAILWFNILLDFNVLFKKGLGNERFLQLGPQEVHAATVYYYDKYNTIHGYLDNAPFEYVESFYADYTNNTSTGNSSYSFDPINNSYSAAGIVSDTSHYSTVYGPGGTSGIYKYVSGKTPSGYLAYSVYYRDASKNSPTILKDQLVQSNITAFDGAYPDNGVHTDGFWYIKGNALPGLTVISPLQNSTFYEADTGFIPQISVIDANNDSLTCKYYIDSETIVRDTKTVTDTSTNKKVNLNILNMSTLTEGNHTMKYEVSDNITSPVTSSISFKVDKSAPTISSATVSSAANSITVAGSATDSIAGLASYPYRYSIGTDISSWLNSTTYTWTGLSPNT